MFLGQIKLSLLFPEIASKTGWTVPAGQGKIINVFGHGGALLGYGIRARQYRAIGRTPGDKAESLDEKPAGKGRVLAGEKIVSLAAEDFAALVVTNKRYLNFNGQSGVWGLQERGINR